MPHIGSQPQWIAVRHPTTAAVRDQSNPAGSLQSPRVCQVPGLVLVARDCRPEVIPAPPDAFVDEPKPPKLRRLIDVAAVNHDGPTHQFLNTAEIELLKLIPLGDDD